VACLQITPHKGEYFHICIAAKPLHGGKKLFMLGEGEDVYIDESDGIMVRVHRDLEGEKKNLVIIRQELERIYKNKQNFDPDFIKYLLDPKEDVDIMEPEYVLSLVEFVQDNPDVMYAEWPKQGRLNLRKIVATGSSFSASIQLSTRGQWFEVEGEVRIDENTVLSMSKLLDLVNKSKSNYIRLENGDFIALGAALRRQLSTINSIAARDKGNIRISPFSAALLDDSTLDGVIKFDTDEYVRTYRKRILDSSEYSPAVPAELKAELRPYQLEGYQWIARLNSWGAGALLADDMGLGKTIQSISFFLLKADEGPTLVVAPASVAPNWMSELEKFAPSLNCKFLNSELSRKEVIDKAGPRDVVVTTYGLLLSVSDYILKKEWKVACLDEAHIIKNRGAKTSGVAMKLNAENRIMLTGTPIQNHLSELWSLFQFVNPGLLGGYSDFSNRFVIPIERDKDEERQEMLERVVHPFMLRRTKNAVLKELPEKTEIYQTIQMSNEESAIYEVIRMRAENMLRELGDESMDVNVLAEITRLRQASCSAQLVEPSWQGPCSKVTALIELLSDVIEGGNRALVFSQFT
ncbi:MAG: DEAD/DEAH box helicase, partial [Bacteroidaceae bacterium]|nr:DEAD/DEAH box helicase [Bacteroidaceae bacterium]